jgi:hypothetical protein
LNLVIRKTGVSEYTLFSDKGIAMYTMDRCFSKDEAMRRATVWASSWNAVIIRIEDEQSKQGN